LVASAYALHLARRSTNFGFTAGGIKLNMKRVKARTDHVVRSRAIRVGAQGVGWQ
jgi:hypothetical protein